VACRQLREGANVPLGNSLQQGNIRDRLFPRRACLYDDACHVASLGMGSGDKEPGGGRQVTRFF